MLTKNGYFWTTYLPRPVNVVCERPLIVITVVELRGSNKSMDSMEIIFHSVGPKKKDFWPKINALKGNHWTYFVNTMNDSLSKLDAI